MLELIMTAAVGLIGLVGGYLLAQQKQTVQESILKTVNITANEQIKTSLGALFAHYAALIINGNAEEAALNADLLTQKIEHFKSLEKKVGLLDNVLANINSHE